MSVLAGGGVAGAAYAASFADGLGANAIFNSPIALAVDAGGGRLIVAEATGNALRAVDTSSGAVTTYAGYGDTPSFALGSVTANTYMDGTGTNAAFLGLTGVVVGAAGVVYIDEASTNALRLVSGPPTRRAASPPARCCCPAWSTRPTTATAAHCSPASSPTSGWAWPA